MNHELGRIVQWPAAMFVIAILLTGCATSDNSDPQPRSSKISGVVPDSSDAHQSCDPNYEGPCIPLVSYDLDCSDVNGPVYVVGTDIHGFDRDRDGIGCEPWP